MSLEIFNETCCSLSNSSIGSILSLLSFFWVFTASAINGQESILQLLGLDSNIDNCFITALADSISAVRFISLWLRFSISFCLFIISTLISLVQSIIARSGVRSSLNLSIDSTNLSQNIIKLSIKDILEESTNIPICLRSEVISFNVLQLNVYLSTISDSRLADSNSACIDNIFEDISDNLELLSFQIDVSSLILDS